MNKIKVGLEIEAAAREICRALNVDYESNRIEIMYWVDRLKEIHYELEENYKRTQSRI